MRVRVRVRARVRVRVRVRVSRVSSEHADAHRQLARPADLAWLGLGLGLG